MYSEEKDPFKGLKWEVEIVRLADPHVPFNSSPKHGLTGAKQYRDDYKMTPFSQSI